MISARDKLFVNEHMQTPMVPVTLSDGSAQVWCKLEFLNPSGSTKDRIASFILQKAYREGKIGPTRPVVEASSGSTSIAMAMVCAQLGVKFIAVMPAAVSNERCLLIKGLGGEVHLAPEGADMVACLAVAEDIARERDGFLPRQFENPDNSNAHRFGTAREVLEQAPGSTVDAIVAGVGTGGTLAGLFQGLSDAGCRPLVCAARPVTPGHGNGVCCGRAVCCCKVTKACYCDAECSSFSNRIPGVVDNMSGLIQPDTFPRFRVVEVEDREALATTRELHRLGFPVGPSAGLNMAASLKVASELWPEATVVTVFPDRVERYFSTGLLETSNERIER